MSKEEEEGRGLEYACKRCGYASRFPQALKRHLQRKKACEPLLRDVSVEELLDACMLSPSAGARRSITCCGCGKAFASVQSRWNHQKRTGCGRADMVERDASAGDEGRKVRELETRIQELQEELKRVGKPEVQNVYNNTQTITQNNNNTIVINGFGKESLEHISAQFLDQCVRRTDKGLVELIERIHFDPRHQENRNLRVTNMKMPIMQVHNGTAWRYDKKDRVLNELVDKGHGIMQDHFDDHEDRIKDEVSETMFDHIQMWMDKMHDRDKKTWESVLTDIYVLILNAGMAPS